MSGSAVSEAALPLVPTSDSGTTQTSVSGTSTAAVAVGNGGGGTFIQMICDVDFYIIFGQSNVTAAVVATHMRYPANQLIERYVPASVTHFRAIAGSAGTLIWCRG